MPANQIASPAANTAANPAANLANNLPSELSTEPSTDPPTELRTELPTEPSIGLYPAPEQTFPNRDELVGFVRQWGLKQGYVTTIKSSNPDRRVYLHCDRSGIYFDRINAPDGTKRRRTSTRRQNCPFLVYGSRQKDSNWLIKVRNSTHNHPADFSMIGHPIARRFTPEQNNSKSCNSIRVQLRNRGIL